MAGVLQGVRVIEGSAFVAVPLAGMTPRADGRGRDPLRPDRGGLDAQRWPVTSDGRSLFWAGLNKGKRSFAVDLASPRGRELVDRADRRARPRRRALHHQPARCAAGWTTRRSAPAAPDLSWSRSCGDRHGGPAVDYTVNPAVGFPTATGPEGSAEPVAHVLPAWDCIAGQMVATGLLAAERHRRRTGEGQLVELSAEGRGGGDARQPRHHRRGDDQRRRPRQGRQHALRRLRPGLRLRRRPAGDGDRR